MPDYLIDVKTQEAALRVIAKLIQTGGEDPYVRRVAKIITSSCDARDDLCELQSIYDAVKTGDSRVPGLENGVRYVSDPQSMDAFVGPSRLLKECREGACAEDCDGVTALVGALAAAVGFRVGARAYGRRGSRSEYTHVYPVVALPKHGKVKRIVGLDTTVPDAEVGWEPPEGHALTAWLDPEK